MESMQPWVAGGQQARPNPDEQASNELSADQREMNRKLGVSDEIYLKYHKGLPE
jgi:hypothetical protein